MPTHVRRDGRYFRTERTSGRGLPRSRLGSASHVLIIVFLERRRPRRKNIRHRLMCTALLRKLILGLYWVSCNQKLHKIRKDDNLSLAWGEVTEQRLEIEGWAPPPSSSSMAPVTSQGQVLEMCPYHFGSICACWWGGLGQCHKSSGDITGWPTEVSSATRGVAWTRWTAGNNTLREPTISRRASQPRAWLRSAFPTRPPGL